MSCERSLACLIHARHFSEDSKNESVSSLSRAFLAVQSGELMIKAIYFKRFPKTPLPKKLRKHSSRELLDLVCKKAGIKAPKDVIEAVERVEALYEASRYPDDAANYFGTELIHPGCQRMPDKIPEILRDTEIIFKWAETELDK